MTNSNLEAVLRRDRLVVAGAVGVIVALAWGYVLWLATDTDMGGMDMTGFRMIPAGMGIMAPANAPWRAIEFAFVFAMWAVMMVGMMAPSATPMILMYARVGRVRLFPHLDRLFFGRDPCPMGGRTGGFARFPDGKRQQHVRRNVFLRWRPPC